MICAYSKKSMHLGNLLIPTLLCLFFSQDGWNSSTKFGTFIDASSTHPSNLNELFEYCTICGQQEVDESKMYHLNRECTHKFHAWCLSDLYKSTSRHLRNDLQCPNCSMPNDAETLNFALSVAAQHGHLLIP